MKFVVGQTVEMKDSPWSGHHFEDGDSSKQRTVTKIWESTDNHYLINVSGSHENWWEGYWVPVPLTHEEILSSYEID